MKKPMTLGGIGPKLALLSLPYIILSLVIMFTYPNFFNLKFLDFPSVKVFGFVWLGLGIIFWISSAIFFLKYFKTGKLITKGPFSLCRNPIYSSIIIFIIPSLGLIFHSGLILSIALVLYIGFKISIHGESRLLRRIFRKEYDIYKKSVNEIFPFPRYLFREKKGNSRGIIIVIILILAGVLIWGLIGSSQAAKIGTTCDFGIGNDGSALCWKWHRNIVGQVTDNLQGLFGKSSG
jgi:protein-S-isoprenylcysteine O-methyltransferase Ste14